MSIFRINGVDPKDLGILDVALSFVNMENDVCTLTMGNNYDEAISSGLDFGQMVSVTLDGNQVFFGESQGASRSGSGPAESITITCFGGWNELSNVPLVQNVTDIVTGGTFLSDRVSLSGSLLSIVTSILNVAYSASSGARVRMGTYDLPAMTLPKLDFTAQTVGRALKDVLKWSPGVQVIFDYSSASATVYPVVHVLMLGSSSLASIPLTDIISRQHRQRSDLSPRGVKIVYERQISSRTTTYESNAPNASSSSAAQTGVTKISEETAGLVSPRRRSLWVTIRLAGSCELTRHQFTFGGPYQTEAYYHTPFNYSGYTHYPRIGDLIHDTGGSTYSHYNEFTHIRSWVPSSFTVCRSFSISSSYEGAGSPPSSDKCWVIPSNNIPISLIRVWGATASTGRVAGFRTDVLVSHWYETFESSAVFVHVHPLPQGSKAWMAGGSPTIYTSPEFETIYRDVTTVSSDAEVAAPGLAAAVFSQFSTVYAEGSMVRQFSSIFPLQRTILIDGVRTPVQEVSFSGSNMIQSIGFGPPIHLAPQDLFLLLRNISGS